MMSFGHLEVFLFKFSIHVGVVTICSMGIMLMSTSLWVNLVSEEPEPKNWSQAVHWTVVSVFDVSGLGIYTLGMVAAYSEVSRLANLLLILMILHGLLWLALTILSFGNWATINRAVCIDNRCADRLFIKNGNWRIAFGGDCENPSMERWLLSGGHYRLTPLPQPSSNETKREDSPVKEERNSSLRLRRAKNFMDKKYEVVEIVRMLSKNVTLTGRRFDTLMVHRSLSDDVQYYNALETASGYNKTLVHTPLGYVGCNAIPHVAYSAVCALLIFGCWYVYPILVVKSYAENLRKKNLAVEHQ